jgi:hypothetical protein
MALPIDRKTLHADILELVRRTDLNSLTSKFVRTQMEKKHNTKLSDFRKEIDAIIRESIEKIETDKPQKTSNGTASNAAIKIEPKSEPDANNPANNVAKREPSPPPKADTPISLADFAFEVRKSF